MKRSRVIATVTALVALLGVSSFAIYEAHNRPIVSVRVAGDLRFTDREELQASIVDTISASLYQVDVSDVRAGALTLAWVKDASVRRVWPDALHVAVLERDPVARWHDGGLVENDATIFHPDNAHAFQHLPVLEGPDGTAPRVLDRYWVLQSALRPLGWEIRRLTLSARRAWVLDLDNGIRLNLGQAVNEQNIVNLVKTFENRLAGYTDHIDQVDLRYTNGFAIRWKRRLQTQSEGGQG